VYPDPDKCLWWPIPYDEFTDYLQAQYECCYHGGIAFTEDQKVESLYLKEDAKFSIFNNVLQLAGGGYTKIESPKSSDPYLPHLNIREALFTLPDQQKVALSGGKIRLHQNGNPSYIQLKGQHKLKGPGGSKLCYQHLELDDKGRILNKGSKPSWGGSCR
jgi:hypothetical protein